MFFPRLLVIIITIPEHSSIIPINDLRSEKGNFSDDEISLRCSLASLFRLIDMEGWAKSIYNLITVIILTAPLICVRLSWTLISQLRISSAKNHYYVNPFGLLYHEITASSLIKIDSTGNIVDTGCTVLGINKRNWAMHEAIYNNRKDVNCIVQLSLPDVVAVSYRWCLGGFEIVFRFGIIVEYRIDYDEFIYWRTRFDWLLLFINATQNTEWTIDK